MTISAADGVITASGACAVDEAEILLRLLLANPVAKVDLSATSHMHTALWQVLMVCRPEIVGVPVDPFATKWLLARNGLSPGGAPAR
jgi:hypothetical protein